MSDEIVGQCQTCGQSLAVCTCAMSDEIVGQCPVSPQELRAYAAHTEDWSVTTADKLYALADWLEKPAPAAASEPTREAEEWVFDRYVNGVKKAEGARVHAVTLSEAVKKAHALFAPVEEGTEFQYVPASPAQARPQVTREQVFLAIRAGALMETRLTERITDEIMKLLESE